jgi:hypothetical protein
VLVYNSKFNEEYENNAKCWYTIPNLMKNSEINAKCWYTIPNLMKNSEINAKCWYTIANLMKNMKLMLSVGIQFQIYRR